MGELGRGFLASFVLSSVRIEYKTKTNQPLEHVCVCVVWNLAYIHRQICSFSLLVSQRGSTKALPYTEKDNNSFDGILLLFSQATKNRICLRLTLTLLRVIILSLVKCVCADAASRGNWNLRYGKLGVRGATTTLWVGETQRMARSPGELLLHERYVNRVLLLLFLFILLRFGTGYSRRK